MMSKKQYHAHVRLNGSFSTIHEFTGTLRECTEWVKGMLKVDEKTLMDWVVHVWDENGLSLDFTPTGAIETQEYWDRRKTALLGHVTTHFALN